MQIFQTSSDISTPEKLALLISDPRIAKYRDIPEGIRLTWMGTQIYALCLILHYQAPSAVDVRVDAMFADKMIMENDGLKALTQVEMQEAFRRGIAKEYGEFYGITASSLIGFLKGFRGSAKRQQAIGILYDQEQKRIQAEKERENRLMYELKAHGFVNPWGKKEKKMMTQEEIAEHKKKIERQREEILKNTHK